MNDEMPVNLPRYVFRRANGSFRYKRNVPKRLRALLGKDTLHRPLRSAKVRNGPKADLPTRLALGSKSQIVPLF